MNFFDSQNVPLLPAKMQSFSQNSNYESDNETRSRTLSESSIGSLNFQDSLSSSPQNNLLDLNLLLALLSQKTQPPSPSSEVPLDDFRGLLDIVFSDVKPVSQVQIPKPIRNRSPKQSESVQENKPSMNFLFPPQNLSQNFLFEASLNLISSLMRNDQRQEVQFSNQNHQVKHPNVSQNILQISPTNINQQQMSTNFRQNPEVCHVQEVQQQFHSNEPVININNIEFNFQSSIPYQPNIIFGVTLTPEEAQRRREHRLAKIKKYLFKKETRKWDVLRYEVRKKIAKTRQRVKGRFVKEEKKNDSFEESKSPNSMEFNF